MSIQAPSSSAVVTLFGACRVRPSDILVLALVLSVQDGIAQHHAYVDVGDDAAPAPARVELQAWGIRDPGALVVGQLSLLKDPARPRFMVYYLSEERPIERIVPMTRHPTDSTDVLFVTGLTKNQNRLGGYFNTFQRAPSSARLGIATAPDGRRGLRFRCDRRDTGFCGMWVHLFDFSMPHSERAFLDARHYSHLSMWMRGTGLESLAIKAADATWEQREDALALGLVGQYRMSDTERDGWHRIAVPLHMLSDRLDRSMLASIVLEATAPGSYDLFMKDISFVRSPDVAPGLSDAESADDETIRPDMTTWVWNTAELLANLAQRDSLIAFLRRQGFNRVFLQLPGDSAQKAIRGEIKIDIASLRTLVGHFVSNGIEVDALDGYAGYARTEYHRGVLATVDNVIAYNNAVADEERFRGIRFDIEPYLLDGFHGRNRQTILFEFLDLLAAAAARCRGEAIRFAADIPFWYDARSKFTGKPVEVFYDGATKPASHHIIDLVDEVAIMDYRTVAWGADGTIRHGTGEMEYAAAVGKSVLVGLETYMLPDEELIEFEGRAERGMPAAGVDAVVMAMRPDGAAELGPSEILGPGADADSVSGPVEYWWWPVRRRIAVPADKITFHSLGASRLEETLRETAEGFSGFPSFAGFAIHDSRSYKELIERTSRPGAAAGAH